MSFELRIFDPSDLEGFEPSTPLAQAQDAIYNYAMTNELPYPAPPERPQPTAKIAKLLSIWTDIRPGVVDIHGRYMTFMPDFPRTDFESIMALNDTCDDLGLVLLNYEMADGPILLTSLWR